MGPVLEPICSVGARVDRIDRRREQLLGHLSDAALLLAVLAAAFAALSPTLARAEDCSLSNPAGQYSSRNVQLGVHCPDAPFFKLSESPDFEESVDTGVVVQIDGIGSGAEYADVSIRFPNGTPGGAGTPFAVTTDTRELRILTVLFDFSDGAGVPSYATPGWAEKLVFSGDHDGRGLANSIKAHIEQSTYGTVAVSGEVYPSWVTVSPTETYRDLDLSPLPDRKFAEEIVQKLVETDPGFFVGKEFDFLIALTPGGLLATTARADNLYSNWPDPHGIFEGWAMFDIPIDSGSALYHTIENELRVSATATRVVPRTNPASVEGVWLADDTNHTGTNYWTGGAVSYDVSNPNAFVHFIELGTPLPAANTEVIVTYHPRASVRVTDEQMALAAPDTLPETRKFGHLMHELYHGLGWLLNPDGRTIGDLYHSPQQLIDAYGLMAAGAWNDIDVDGVRHYVPATLSGFSKLKLGIVQPYVVRYGEDEIALRLHKTEEGEFDLTDARTKLIKVPLHPPGDEGHQQLSQVLPAADLSFEGEEYLLLEWRHTGTLLENGAYNFDEALPDEGLVVYRVIEGDAESAHGDPTTTMVRILDATPAIDALPSSSLTAFWMEDVFSLVTSPAPYGVQSGVTQRVAGAPWNWKIGDDATAGLLLSPEAGEKTVYARFMDLAGQIVGETSLTLSSSEPPAEPENEPPVADAGNAQTLVDDDGDGMETVTLNASASSDPDGSVASCEWYEGGALLATGETPIVSLNVGVHDISLVVYDDLGATGVSGVRVDVVAANLPPVADAGPDIDVVDVGGGGVASVTLDGTASQDPDGSLAAHDWYEAGVRIASGPVVAVDLSTGSHGITLVVADDRGETHSDSVVVRVLEGDVQAPSGLTATVSADGAELAWSDNADNETGFIVERGSKAKGGISYVEAATLERDTTRHGMTLSSGTYFFRVRAVGASGVSPYSNAVEVRIRSGGGSGSGGGGGKNKNR